MSVSKGFWIFSLKMSDLYELKSIDGKGLGAIAKQNIKRGTLILEEKPQISDDDNDIGKPEWIKSVWESFKRMRKLDQEEYLKLPIVDIVQNTGLSPQAFQIEVTVKQMYGNESLPTIGKILKTINIFKSNFWLNTDATWNKKARRVFIHSSRFNHSCQPNVRMWTLPNDQMICRTTKKIKAGEELTFSYAPIPFGLKNREFRQKFLKDQHDLICICDFCKVETEDKNDVAAFEAFEKEELELKRLTNANEGLKGPNVKDCIDYEAIFQNAMKQIQCYKNIYNLGKKNNACWNYLYENVLLKGVELGLSTIQSAYSSKQMLALLTGDGFHFLEEVEKLLKTAKTMDDAIGVTNEECFMWQYRKNTFESILSPFTKTYDAVVAAFPSLGSNLSNKGCDFNI